MITLRHQILSCGLLIGLLPTLSARPAARLVKDINLAQGAGGSQPLNYLEARPGGVLFPNYSPETGVELWISKANGTRLLKDINPGMAHSWINSMLTVDGVTYFTAHDGVHGEELWRTDGSSAGTRLFLDLEPGLQDSSAEPILGVAGKLYVRARGGALYVTDSAGTAPVLLNSLSEGQFAFHPLHAAAIGDRAYFVSSDNELWSSDGTAAGTVKLPVLPFAGAFDYVAWMKVVGNKLFFALNNRLRVWSPGMAIAEDLGDVDLPWGSTRGGQEAAILDNLLFTFANGNLIVSDGTTVGTRIVKESSVFDPLSLESTVFAWRGHVYFPIIDSQSEATQLWRTDGTEQGTMLVKEIGAATSGTELRHFGAAGDFLYFYQSLPDHRSYLWRTDGTAAGTVEAMPDISLGNSQFFPHPVALGESLYFSSAHDPIDSLWKTGGTSRTTKRLTKAPALNRSFFDYNQDNGIVSVDRQLILLGKGTMESGEIWRSNGSARGTRLVAPVESPVESCAALGSRALFLSGSGDTKQLMITDGRVAGTRGLIDLTSSTGINVKPENFLSVGETCYFVTTGGALWKTDGTEAGTIPVQDDSGPVTATPGSLTELNGILYFFSADDNLWRSDGSTVGTAEVKELPLERGETVGDLIRVGDHLHFFTGNDTLRNVWTSDGTTGGTGPIGEVSGKIGVAADLDGTLVFLSFDTTAGEVKGYRGSETEIVHYATLPAGNEISLDYAAKKACCAAGSNVFFVCGEDVGEEELSWELWKTDGSSQGTGRVKKIKPLQAHSNDHNGAEPWNFLAVGDELYFTADDGLHGMELWRSDGTEAGTVIAVDVVPGALDSYPSMLTLHGSRLYFSAETDSMGAELYSLPVPKRKSK